MRLWGRTLISSEVSRRIFTLIDFHLAEQICVSIDVKLSSVFIYASGFLVFMTPEYFRTMVAMNSHVVTDWSEAAMGGGGRKAFQDAFMNADAQFQGLPLPTTVGKSMLIFGLQMRQRSQWRAIRMTTAHLRSLWPRCWKSSAWRTPQVERVPTWWRTNLVLDG